MALRNPIFLVIGLILVFILILIRFKKKKFKKDSGKLVANTSYVKKLNYYKELVSRYKILTGIIKGVCLVSIMLCFVNFARPHSRDTINVKQYSRDIMLCMDVSFSVNHLNKQIVNNMKETVNGLHGERFGISIFNTTSILLSPLSDDYDFILESLDDINASIDAINKYGIGTDYSTYEYIISGTIENNTELGSSLIGDGLASCVLSFPKMDEERTRIIIFSTDNDPYSRGTPLFNLNEAAELAKKKNVKVFGVATSNTTSAHLLEFEKAVELTGGKFYKESNGSSVKEIVKDIEATSKTLTVVDERKVTMDEPLVPFIGILLCVGVIFVVDRRLRNGY